MFHLIRMNKRIPEPGDPALETWADSSWAYSGNGNVWTLMSADDELAEESQNSGHLTQDD